MQRDFPILIVRHGLFQKQITKTFLNAFICGILFAENHPLFYQETNNVEKLLRTFVALLTTMSACIDVPGPRMPEHIFMSLLGFTAGSLLGSHLTNQLVYPPKKYTFT